MLIRLFWRNKANLSFTEYLYALAHLDEVGKELGIDMDQWAHQNCFASRR